LSGQEVCIFSSSLLFLLNIFTRSPAQTQLASHGFPMAYSDRRGSDAYGASLAGSGGAARLGAPISAHDHDPLALHQALQNAVDDQEQNQVCDEAGTTFMTDLPMLKSESSLLEN
jgi:transcription factor AP-2, invertebrate